MALYSTSVEYGLHCLLPLCAPEIHASSQDLAEFQGVSPAYVAKLFASLRRAGLVEALEGAGGGYRLARPAAGDFRARCRRGAGGRQAVVPVQ